VTFERHFSYWKALQGEYLKIQYIPHTELINNSAVGSVCELLFYYRIW